MMKKNLLFYLIPILVAINVSNLIGQNILYTPTKYIKPCDTITKPYPSEMKTGEYILDKLWVVYSDRTKNYVFAKEDSNSIVGSLLFREKCGVVHIGQNRLKICRWKNVIDGIVTTDNTFWIDYNKLLLSKHCLITISSEFQNGFNRKGMILNKIDSLSLRGDNPEAINYLLDNLNYYSSPEKHNQKHIDRAYPFAFCFIYKDLDSCYLVGKASSMEGVTPSENLLGWIYRHDLIEWDHKIAWELNWHPDAAAERKELNNTYGTLILKSKEDAIGYKKYGTTFDIGPGPGQVIPIESTQDIYEAPREFGFQSRYPLLYDDINLCDINGPRKLGVMSSLKSLNGNINEDEYKNLLNEIKTIEANQRKINIIFVIDATKSMIQYKGAIKQSLENAFTEMKVQHKRKKNILSFGAVLYRDDKDDSIISVFNSGKVSTDTSKFNQWLSLNMKGSLISGRDTTLPEAMYYGIKKGVESYKLDKRQSNYMVIIGDAGDHRIPGTRTYVDENEMINSISDHNINIIAYQVYRKSIKNHRRDSTYNDFLNQIKTIVTKSNELIYNEIRTIPVDNHEELSCELITNDSMVYHLSKDCPLQSKIIISQKDSILKTDTLQYYLSECIQRIYYYVDRKVFNMARVISEGESVTTQDVSATSIIYTLWVHDIDIETIKKICSSNKFIYQEGYSCIKITDMESRLFQPVIFLDKKQLLNFKTRINRTITNDSLRDDIVLIFKDIIKCLIGEDVKISDTSKIGYVIQHHSGFRIDTKYYNWTIENIKEVASKTSISDDCLHEFRVRLQKHTLIKIDEMLYEGSKYPGIHNNFHDISGNELFEQFYWVPMDFLPHQNRFSGCEGQYWINNN